ncbi:MULTISPECIES: class I SAM-dependent methyltransferase [Halolamina]|uniref:Methyltransferase domain-containing protein n=1 Tax=Halolamina pelagica TaxID=699431 RepID=A0A1I5MKG2_9EURY|nr:MULTISPECIES: class I SAM-dependent methyltransferase [Halolamina]NHX36045.1 class I SAM-dependent methyltransferase [Halolamina sp. R1-12]SFP09441.1 Methyltransferase domain-containing protein [Halolamina pelagica]
MASYFGVYHWRRRFRRLFGALALVVAGLLAWRRGGRLARLVGLALAAAGAKRGYGPLDRVLSPPPWQPDRWKYRAPREAMPYADAERALDVGCGTGRSLVGLAPAVPADCRLTGLDVFDDRVILGNGPGLARRNAAEAGLGVDVVAGDAARLPVADDTHDVVTACRVLHDLPKETAESALTEARRVLGPEGTLGVLELPVPHDPDADPLAYWQSLVEDAGFAVEEAREVDGGSYFLLVATPEGAVDSG